MFPTAVLQESLLVLGKMKLDVRYGNKQEKVKLTVEKGQGLLASWTRLDELHTACLEEDLPS